MCTIVKRLSIIGAVFLLTLTSATAQTTTKWQQEVSVDEQLHAKWTYIGSSSGTHYEDRILYQDGASNLFVLRLEGDATTGVYTSIIEYLQTGETLTFDANAVSFTLSSSTHQVTGTKVLLENYGPGDATELPPSLVAEAASVLGSLSEGFRDALRTLVYVGCNETMHLFVRVAATGHLVYYEDPHIDCTEVAPNELSSEMTGFTQNFDPYQFSPNTFEQQFGSAYYE